MTSCEMLGLFDAVEASGASPTRTTTRALIAAGAVFVDGKVITDCFDNVPWTDLLDKTIRVGNRIVVVAPQFQIVS